jgi:hypothetical protein
MVDACSCDLQGNPGLENTKHKGDRMKGYDNQGRLISEQNVSYTSDGKCITSSTTYDSASGRPIFQNVSVRGSDGKVAVTNILNGKILP